MNNFFNLVITIFYFSIETLAFDMQCPHPSHWNYRGNARCENNSDYYYCLYDDNKGHYKEICGNDRVIQQRKGNKVVIRGWLDKDSCVKERYQPFKFITKGNTNCSLLKSTCTEEGQVIHSEGNSSSNRLCRCDHTNGYDFVMKPSATCFCNSEIEDCSCHIVNCPNDTHLTPDYRCLSIANWTQSFACSYIDNDGESAMDELQRQSKERYQDTDSFPQADVPIGILSGTRIILIVVISNIIIVGVVYSLRKFYWQIVELYADDNGFPKGRRRSSTVNPEKEYSAVNITAFIKEDEVNRLIPSKEAILELNKLRNTKDRQSFDISPDEVTYDCELKTLVTSNANHLLMQTLQTYMHSPLTYMIKTVKEMKSDYQDNNDFRFCVLLLIVVCKNRFEIKWLDQQDRKNEFWHRIIEVCNQCRKNVENHAVRTNLKKTFRELQYRFILNPKDIYCIHPVLYTVVVFECGNACFDSVLKYIDIKNVAETYQLGKEVNDKIVVSKEKECMYFNRLIDDLKTGNGYSFFHNPQLSDATYRSKFMTHLNENKNNVKMALHEYKSMTVKNKGRFIEEFQIDGLKNIKQHEFCNININLPLVEVILEGYSDIFELLLNFGCDVNEKDKMGRSALFYATVLSKRGCKYAELLLLSEEIELYHVDQHGRTVLHVACIEGDGEIFKLLLEKQNDLISKKDNGGRSPLHVAVEKNNFLAARELLDRGADTNSTEESGKTALHIAARGENTQIVEDLLDCQADPLLKDNNHWTPLFEACFHRKPAIVQTLLSKNKACINDKDNAGRTPLYLASSEGHSETVEILIKFGADPSIADNFQHLSLQRACEGNHPKTVAALLESDRYCDIIDLKESDDYTPLHVACRRGGKKIVKSLLKKGAQINLKDKNGQTPLFHCIDRKREEIADLLLSKDCNTNECDNDDMSPLNKACICGLTGIARKLLDHKANIQHCNRRNDSSLHLACMGGHLEIVQLLIDRGISINATNLSHATPLFIASQEGHAQVVNILLENNADMLIQNMKSKIPEDVAKTREIVDLFVKKKFN